MFWSLNFGIYLKFGACDLGFNCPFFSAANPLKPIGIFNKPRGV
jgi:hypothetical protein